VSRLQLDADADDDADNTRSEVLGSVSLGDRVWSVAISPNDRSIHLPCWHLVDVYIYPALLRVTPNRLFLFFYSKLCHKST